MIGISFSRFHFSEDDFFLNMYIKLAEKYFFLCLLFFCSILYLKSHFCANTYSKQTTRRSTEMFQKVLQFFSYLLLPGRWKHTGMKLAAKDRVTLLNVDLLTPERTLWVTHVAQSKGEKNRIWLFFATDTALISEVSLHLATSPRWQQTEWEGQTHDCVFFCSPCCEEVGSADAVCCDRLLGRKFV